MLVIDYNSQRQRCLGGQELSQVLARVAVEAQELERERIALETHDGIAQTLASALRYLQSLDGLSREDWDQARSLLVRAGTLTRQAIVEVRAFVHALQPATLSHLGLTATLRQEVCHLEAETGWQVEFTSHCGRLPRDAELALYRIAHEAVTNARKHSGIRRLRMTLVQDLDRVYLEVQDWGGSSMLTADPSARLRGRVS